MVLSLRSQNVVGIDAVGVVFCAAHGLHLGAVIAEADGFAPFVGAVAVGPVNDLIAKEDDVSGFCRDQDGVDFVGVVLVWRQMRRGVWGPGRERADPFCGCRAPRASTPLSIGVSSR